MNERIGMIALFLFITFFILPYIVTKELNISRLIFLSLFLVFLFLFLFYIVNKKINTIVLKELDHFLTKGKDDWKKTKDYNSTDLVVIPVSARLCYGFRYFFSYNSALGAEIGVGGPLFSVQYTYKF